MITHRLAGRSNNTKSCCAGCSCFSLLCAAAAATAASAATAAATVGVAYDHETRIHLNPKVCIVCNMHSVCSCKVKLFARLSYRTKKISPTSVPYLHCTSFLRVRKSSTKLQNLT